MLSPSSVTVSQLQPSGSSSAMSTKPWVYSAVMVVGAGSGAGAGSGVSSWFFLPQAAKLSTQASASSRAMIFLVISISSFGQIISFSRFSGCIASCVYIDGSAGAFVPLTYPAASARPRPPYAAPFYSAGRTYTARRTASSAWRTAIRRCRPGRWAGSGPCRRFWPPP